MCAGSQPSLDGGCCAWRKYARPSDDCCRRRRDAFVRRTLERIKNGGRSCEWCWTRMLTRHKKKRHSNGECQFEPSHRKSVNNQSTNKASNSVFSSSTKPIANKMEAIQLFAFLLFISVVHAHSFTSCSNAAGKLKVTSLELTPDPPGLSSYNHLVSYFTFITVFFSCFPLILTLYLLFPTKFV